VGNREDRRPLFSSRTTRDPDQLRLAPIPRGDAYVGRRGSVGAEVEREDEAQGGPRDDAEPAGSCSPVVAAAPILVFSQGWREQVGSLLDRQAIPEPVEEGRRMAGEEGLKLMWPCPPNVDSAADADVLGQRHCRRR